MHLRASVLVAAVALATAHTGVATAASDVEAQRSAILDCKRSRGIGGAAWIEQGHTSSATSQMVVQIAPYDRVTFQDAAAINACAAGRLGLAPTDGATTTSRTRTAVRSLRQPGGYRGMDCGRNPSILYKGDLYCQWTRR